MGDPYRFVLLLGLVSLLTDTVYEGARSILGQYLAVLGAGSTAVGFVAGVGELLSYSLRFVSGHLADKTRAYWKFTVFGYSLTLISIPLIGFAGSWQAVTFIVLVDRLGKAIRTPSRDTLLSVAARMIGHGKGFGIHESIDRLGAVLGPLFVTIVLSISSSYRVTFLSLLLPSALAVLLLLKAKGSFVGAKPSKVKARNPKLVFYLYLLASSIFSLGFVQFPLIAFHFKSFGVFSDAVIPALFAFAMVLDAISALVFGFLFDRIGMLARIAGVLIGLPFPALVFMGGKTPAYLGIALWAIGLGVQKSVTRSAIARLTEHRERGRAYGMLHFFVGLSIFVGNTLMGFLHSGGVWKVVLYSTLLQLLSVPIFYLCYRKTQE